MTETSKENEMTTADEPRVLHMNTELPSLHIPYPQCSHCGEDVTIDDGVAWCDGCLLAWEDIYDGTVGKPDWNREGTDVPCEIVVGSADKPHDDKRGNHYVPGAPKPCILPSGHGGNHVNPYDVTVTKIAEARS